MAKTRFPTTGDLASVLAQIPNNVKRFLVQGFKILGTLSDAAIDGMMPLLFGMLTKDIPSDSELSRIAKQLQVSDENIPELFGAINLVTNTLSLRSELPDDFVREGRNAGLFGDAEEKNVRQLAELVKTSREKIKEKIDSEDIASEVLPCLEYFEAAVDIRLTFDGDRLRRATPVAIVHIDTDAYQQELWFQMSLSQVEKMIEELNVTIGRLKAAESFGKSAA